jgi:molybdopterin biosynthesis enzyme
VANKSAVSLEDAIGLMDAHVRAVAPKYLPIASAVGKRSVEALSARLQVPPVTLAAENGFGVWVPEAEDLAGPQCAFPISRDAPLLDQCAPLPDGVNAVVPERDVRLRRGQRIAERAVKPGDATLQPGSSLTSGQPIIGAGDLITLRTAYIAEMAGVHHASVRMPMIDVIFNSFSNPTPSDSFVRLVANETGRRGAVIGSVQFAGGDGALLADALSQSAADIILVVGGTSAGPQNTTVPTLRSVGRILFHGVKLDPGGTTSLAEVAGRPVIALPGCIPDLLAASATIMRQISLKAIGRPVHEAETREARLAASLPASGSVVRAHFGHFRDGVFEQIDLSHSYSAEIAHMNGLVVLPAKARARPAGSKVEVMKLRSAAG